MHETYLARCILEKACCALPAGCLPQQVTSVTVSIGLLDAVAPYSLVSMFDAQKKEFNLNQAYLRIAEERVTLKCRDCSEVSRLDEPVFVCTLCGSGRVSILSGKGIMLTEITLSED